MRHVLVVDDHAMTRRGLRELLDEAFENVEVQEAGDAAAIRAQLGARRWDSTLLDILIPDANVIETLSAIRGLDSTVPVLVLTGAKELEYVIQTMKAGANGLVHKHRSSEDILEAIKKVAEGGTYLHAETAAQIAATLHETTPSLPHQKLSERELEIFRQIAQGRAVKQIAASLGLSDKTVATYLARIREKTGLSSHVEMARYALQNGLVE